MPDDLRRTPFEAASALPVGTRLGEFEVRRVLGIGGFGIVYLAFDHDLEREVAVKEYMPASMAGRTETMHVSLRSQSDAEVFALGLRSFVNEAKLLARFDHPSLLKVFRFWEANGTAYMAMPVLRGRTLKDIRQGRQSLENPIDERWLRGLLDALLGALDKLHSEGVYHRDIAPDNILIEPDGHPVLLDFGAARRVISGRTQTLTAILKPAYAPIEQYAEAGSVKQGPWTDLYALGATLHYMLVGQPPAPATARAIDDDHQPPLANRAIDGCSEPFLAAVDWMLAPRPGDRPQSVAALQAVLAGRVPLPRRTVPAAPPVAAAAAWEPTAVLPPMSKPALAAAAASPPEAPAGAADRPAGEDSTLVVPPSRPPARAAATSRAASTSPPAAAPSLPAASRDASGATDGGGAVELALLTSAATPPAARGKALPIGVGVIAAVVVVVAAAFALWPGQGDRPVAVAPATSAAGDKEVPAPASAAALLPAGGPMQAAPAAPVVAQEPAPPTPLVAAPRDRDAPPSAATSAAAPPAAPASLPTPAAVATVRPQPARPAAATTARPAEPSGRASATRAATAPVAAAPLAGSPAATVSASTTAAPTPVESAPTPQAATPGPTVAAPAAAAAPKGPEANCSNRNPVIYFACMERECFRSRNKDHPDCLQWHKDARGRDGSGN